MKILKFGGTSVGSPARMHHLADLINADECPKIVVLSAVSGTTNTLVAIGEALSEKNKDVASRQIEDLKKVYDSFVEELVSSENAKEKAKAIVEEHFAHIRSFINKKFTPELNKELLAQGELLSTKLFSTYLEEKQVPAILIPALDFMVVDEQGEPVIQEIAHKLEGILG